MALRVVGAGLPRTGTHSLKLALERLLGGPCYHMVEVFGHPEHVPGWHTAIRGEPTNWDELLAGYVAAVDWPASACWRELARAYPDALVLLSTRTADSWWTSVDATILQVARDTPSGPDPWHDMAMDLFGGFVDDPLDEASMKAAFEGHNADVRENAPKDRFLEFSAPQGWGPLCTALGLPVPDEPYPHVNRKEDWGRR